MRKLVSLLTTILVLALVIACAPAAPKSPAPAGEVPIKPEETLPPAPTPTTVVSIDIGVPWPENWDADAEVDGLEFDLTPKDAQDKMVRSPGNLSAKLWVEKSILEGGGKGDLVQEWSGIQVMQDDYDIFGATIRLEYSGFQPKEMQFGILEVTLETPDGKSFSARYKGLLLGD